MSTVDLSCWQFDDKMSRRIWKILVSGSYPESIRIPTIIDTYTWRDIQSEHVSSVCLSELNWFPRSVTRLMRCKERQNNNTSTANSWWSTMYVGWSSLLNCSYYLATDLQRAFKSAWLMQTLVKSSSDLIMFDHLLSVLLQVCIIVWALRISNIGMFWSFLVVQKVRKLIRRSEVATDHKNTI